ncbi:MAG: AMP-binding protein, partial [Anaerolineales bacterium]|nr:AMP-binding protein [Anaerolineales bacterium]
MTNQAQFPFDQPIVWRPSQDYLQRSRLKRFIDHHGLATYEKLIERSTSDIAWFWEAVFEDLGIEFYQPYTQVVDLSGGIQWPEWCVGGQLNIVHNCLDKWMDTPTQNRVAIRYEAEDGDVRLLTYRELFCEVNRVAGALRAAGLGKGDAIGLFMPMLPEIAIALLAIAKIGGVILPLFSGYGPGAVATRLVDAEAKAVFTADGMFRRGRHIAMKPIVDQALRDVPSVGKVIVYKRTGMDVPMSSGRDVWWHDFVADQPAIAPTEHTDAEDIIMIIYTSGTTGRPKGAVHTHCGFPIKCAQDMAHGFDIQEFDT